MSHRRVVITGLGVVAPNGIGRSRFWENLLSGKSAVDRISTFDASSYPCQVAAEVRDFSPTDFMHARKAKTMARFSHLAVASTRLAIEDAELSITPSLSPSIGICYGTCVSGLGDVVGDWIETLLKGARSVTPSSVRPSAALQYPPHAAASCVAIEFGIRGPALSVSSNCCSGLDAIGAAASQITSGKAKVAIAGACDTPIFPTPFASFCALGALTRQNSLPEKASRPYDLLRDGLVLAEGGATLVLEDSEFAQARGARIYAEILGYGASSEAIGMREGDLSGNTMAAAIASALRSANLAASDIDHINAHGSSLPDYDVCDTNAFKVALGTHAYRIPITSIKSMIGQPISAAGTIQTTAACLSIEHQRVPPTINQEVEDPRCDLDYVPNKFRVVRVKRVLINGHSFGGSCSALVIGQYS